MRNAVIRFCNSTNVIPYLASLGNKVVIRIDHKKCSDVLFIGHFCDAPSGLCGHPSRPAGLTEMALPAPLAMRQKCAAGRPCSRRGRRSTLVGIRVTNQAYSGQPILSERVPPARLLA